VLMVLSALGMVAWFKLLNEERSCVVKAVFARFRTNKDLARELGSESW